MPDIHPDLRIIGDILPLLRDPAPVIQYPFALDFAAIERAAAEGCILVDPAIVLPELDRALSWLFRALSDGSGIHAGECLSEAADHLTKAGYATPDPEDGAALTALALRCDAAREAFGHSRGIDGIYRDGCEQRERMGGKR